MGKVRTRLLSLEACVALLGVAVYYFALIGPLGYNLGRADVDGFIGGVREFASGGLMAGSTGVEARSANCTDSSGDSLGASPITPSTVRPVTLYLDGQQIGEGRVEATIPIIFSGDETLDPRRTLLSELHDGTLAELVDAVQVGLHHRRRLVCHRPVQGHRVLAHRVDRRGGPSASPPVLSPRRPLIGR